MSLTFGSLRVANVVRCNTIFHPLESWSPCDWATALAGEVGEACNQIKKLRRLEDGIKPNPGDADTPPQYIENIAEELADAVIYADLLAARLGIDLELAVVSKFNKVSKQRNYSGRISR
jgi:NTP pyrophosphatase (non-canonical NTP hydrolase)